MNNRVNHLSWLGWALLSTGILFLFLVAPMYPQHLGGGTTTPIFLTKVLGYWQSPLYFSPTGKPVLTAVWVSLFLMSVGFSFVLISFYNSFKYGKICSSCDAVYRSQKDLCSKCGVRLEENRCNSKVLFRVTVLSLTIIGSYMVACNLESIVFHTRPAPIQAPGNVFRLTYSFSVGVLVGLIVFVMPGLISSLLNRKQSTPTIRVEN